MPQPHKITDNEDYYKATAAQALDGGETRMSKFERLMGMHKKVANPDAKKSSLFNKSGPARSTYDPNQVQDALEKQYNSSRFGGKYFTK